MFVKLNVDKDEYIEEYQGVVPDIKTGSYVVYVSTHHIDLIHFRRGVFSMAHLCLPHNSCVQLALDFIDTLKKQLSLF